MYEIWEGKDGRDAGGPTTGGSAKHAMSAPMAAPRGIGPDLAELLRVEAARDVRGNARVAARTDGGGGDGRGDVGVDAGGHIDVDIEADIEMHGVDPSTRSVHIAIYEHRYGLDISAHETHESAHAALVDIARGQCARDPAIREAVCGRYGTWPAGDMTAAELERLLDEWNDLAPDEALWIAECAIESEVLRERRRAFMTPPE